MDSLPDSLLGIIAASVDAHSDVGAALDAALAEWRQCEERDEWLDLLERRAIREMIHNRRHTLNIKCRVESGVYGQPAKVSAASAEVGAVTSQCLLTTYSIANVKLGSILGEQLLGFAKTEQAKADGAAFNARLCESLAQIVPEGKTVGEVVSNARMRKIFQSLGRNQRVNKKQRRAKPVVLSSASVLAAAGH